MSRFHSTMEEATEELEKFNFDRYADALYQFLWHEYCDWYIEMSKLRLDEGEGAFETKKVLYQVLSGVLKALHPAMPFITEKIYGSFDVEDGLIFNARWPEPDAEWSDVELEKEMQRCQEIIRSARHLKKEFQVQTSEGVNLHVSVEKFPEQQFQKYSQYICDLAGLETVQIGSDLERPPAAATEVLDFGTVYLPLSGLIDVEREKERIKGDIDDRRQRLGELQERLDNSQFIENAPEEVVKETRSEYRQVEGEIERLQETLSTLSEA